jgi:hypothetical protein
LHKVYVECATQQNQIIELKEQVSRLKREIADRDNELSFYKSKTDNSSINSLTKSERSSDKFFRESIYINKIASEIPEYSFSVNDDDLDYIYQDFNDENVSTNSDLSFNSVDNSVEVVKKENPFLFKM